MQNDWSLDIESVLENIRINCVFLTQRYFKIVGVL